MSGGTDSSVAAILLKKNNFLIEGITFRSYGSVIKSCDEKEKGGCNFDSIIEAQNLAKDLNINHKIIDLREDFEQTVIKNFIEKVPKKPFIRVNFQASGIDIRVRYYTIASERQKISSDITEEIFNKIMKEKKTEFAFPHTKVILEK